jgi:hypothetical protein
MQQPISTGLIPLLLAVVVAAPVSADERSCGAFDQGECMREQFCAYDGHDCVETADPCEISWDELEGTRYACERMTGCIYIPAEPCYCPPDVDCDCGGGAPQRCVSE